MDKNFYNKVVDAYAGNLFRFLHRCIKDPDQAHDLVQDAFVKLWLNKDLVDPHKVKSWLFSTGHNLMINSIKKNQRFKALESQDMEKQISFPTNDFEVKDLVNAYLDQLPEIQKSIILLKDLEGYNYKEIGEILDLSESQVKVYLFRGRQKIKNSLKEKIDQEKAPFNRNIG